MNTKVKWLWEFSKKVVVTCTLIYVGVIFYSCTVMAIQGDFSNLGTLIAETSDILRTCVFGYVIKAGIENVIKMSKSKEKSETINEQNEACG